MKANELMIGDWVLFNDKPKQVRSIVVSDNGVERIYVFGNTCQVSTIDAYIQPIPLTPEILEKNGFKEYNGYGYASNKGYCFEGFYINYDFTTRIANIDCKFNYVHELQHTLKLCGIEKNIII